MGLPGHVSSIGLGFHTPIAYRCALRGVHTARIEAGGFGVQVVNLHAFRVWLKLFFLCLCSL